MPKDTKFGLESGVQCTGSRWIMVMKVLLIRLLVSVQPIKRGSTCFAGILDAISINFAMKR